MSASPPATASGSGDPPGEVGLDIVVGCRMPCHAFTREGVLLLARGERVLNEAQVARLCLPDVLLCDEPPERLPVAVNTPQQAPAWDGAPRDPEPAAPPEKEAKDQPPAPLLDLARTATAEAEKEPTEPLAEIVVDPVKVEQPSVAFDEEIVAARDLRSAAIHQVGCVLDQVRANRPVDLDRANAAVERVLESLLRNERAFASMLRLRRLDDYTFTHSVNCCVLAMMIARRSGVAENLRQIGLGGLLHDIGKVQLPADLLQKPDRLTRREWGLACRHPSLGADIVARSQRTPIRSIESVSQHHERLDGSGYPGHLTGGAVSLAGRLVGVADVYDAMTSDRTYRPAIPPPEAMRWIYGQAGTLFDARFVRALVGAVGLFPIGTLVRLKSGELAVVVDVSPRSPLRPIVLVVSDASGLPIGQPWLIDLSSMPASDGSRDIASTENAAALGIDVDEYLALLPEDQLDAVRAEGVAAEPMRLRLRGIDVLI